MCFECVFSTDVEQVKGSHRWLKCFCPLIKNLNFYITASFNHWSPFNSEEINMQRLLQIDDQSQFNIWSDGSRFQSCINWFNTKRCFTGISWTKNNSTNTEIYIMMITNNDWKDIKTVFKNNLTVKMSVDFDKKKNIDKRSIFVFCKFVSCLQPAVTGLSQHPWTHQQGKF